MSEIQPDVREFAQNRVLAVLNGLLVAANARDQPQLSRLSTTPLRRELIAGKGELFEVIEALGQLHLMPVPTVAVDGRRAVALFPVQGNDYGAFQLMYAALVRTDDLPPDAPTKADIARHIWAVTTLGKAGSSVPSASITTDAATRSREDSVSITIDWDDPTFVIEAANELLGRPECTVADVLKEAGKFTDEGLGLVGRAGGTRVAEYVRERRPELLRKGRPDPPS